MKLIFLTIGLCFLSGLFFWSSKKINSQFEHNCIVIQNAQIFDGIKNFVEKKSLLLKSGIIAEISEFPIGSTDCTILDAQNTYLVPGLIDAHTHLLAKDRLNVKSWKEALELSADQTSERRLEIGFENAESMLFHGFTTLRDLGNSGNFLDAKLKDKLLSSGNPQVELVYSGPPIAVFPSQIDLKNNSAEYQLVDLNTDVIALLQRYKKAHADWIKVYADNSRGRSNLMSAELLDKVIAVAHKQGFQIALHAEYLESILLSLNSKADSIEHFYEAPVKNIPSFQKPFIVLTELPNSGCINLKKNKFQQDECEKIQTLSQKRFIWLKENHYNLVFGSDAVLDFSSGYMNRGEAALNSLLSWKSSGLSNFEILRAATSSAANLLKMKTGRVQVGYKADVLLFKESPLQNLDALLDPQAIIKNGRIVCLSQVKECHDGKY